MSSHPSTPISAVAAITTAAAASNNSAVSAQRPNIASDPALQDPLRPPAEQQCDAGKRGREINIARRRGQRQHHEDGRDAASAKRTAASSSASRRCRQARTRRRDDEQRPGEHIHRQFEQVFARKIPCAAAYCNSGGASTAAKRPTRLFQKNTFKCAGPSVPAVHEPHPGENHHRLYNQIRHTAPSATVRASASPRCSSENGQRRHHPGRGAFAQKSESKCRVHQEVAAQALAVVAA